MNRKNRTTLAAVFSRPPSASVRWTAIETLVQALGGEVVHMGGAVVAFLLNGRRGVFHRPHPAPEARRGQLRRVRRFLENAGVTAPEGDQP